MEKNLTCWCQRYIAQHWQQPGDKNMQIPRWLSQQQLVFAQSSFQQWKLLLPLLLQEQPMQTRGAGAAGVRELHFLCGWGMCDADRMSSHRWPHPSVPLALHHEPFHLPCDITTHTNWRVLVSHMQKWAGLRLSAKTTPAAGSRFWQLPGSCSTIQHYPGDKRECVSPLTPDKLRHGLSSSQTNRPGVSNVWRWGTVRGKWST